MRKRVGDMQLRCLAYRMFKVLGAVVFLALVAGCTLGEDHVDGYVGHPGSGRTTEGGPASNLIVISPTTATLLTNEGGVTNSIFRLSKSPSKNEVLEWKITDGNGVFTDYEGSYTATTTTEEFQLPIMPIDDGLYQGERKFYLDVWGDDEIFYAPVRVEIRVVDSSSAPVVSFANPAQTVAEGDPVTTANVLLSSPAAHTTVVQFTASGHAQEGADFSLSPANTVIFHPGETSKSIEIYIIDDASSESMEDIVLTLSSVSQGAATLDGANDKHTAWVLDNDGTSLFNVTGVTGGADAQQDGFLTNGSTPTVSWSAAPSALAYEVVIFKADGTSIACAPPAPGNYTSYTFVGCSLTEGETYKVSVVATIGTDNFPAGNNMFPFQVVTQAPDDFSIIGVTGGLDISPNSVLSGGILATVHWADSPNEYKYYVSIYNVNGSLNPTTVKCPEVNVPANVTAYAFHDCPLTPGANYKISMRAENVAGNAKAASNDMYLFTVTNQPTGYMITGVTGGIADTLPDDKMTDGQNPVVHWQEALGAISYNVTIWDNAELVQVCPTVNVPATQTSFAFTTCDFNLHEIYKVEVIAYNNDGDDFIAANAKYAFRYMVGLYISGTGQSYYKGVPIITCGGGQGDVCNAATPYEAVDVIVESQVRVANGGVLAAGAWSGGPAVPGNGILEMEVNRLWVEAGSAISMTGRGYTAGLGPGAGMDTTGDEKGGTGGAYGGNSGYSNGQPSVPYGSISNPSHMGSGGGSNLSVSTGGIGPAIGGSGGGIVRVTVAGTMVLEGSIESNGASGTVFSWGTSGAPTTIASGGGAGGSVIVDVQILEGTTGAVKVLGGNRGASFAGSGSGGRALVIVDDDTGFTGGLAGLTTQAYGGTVGDARAGAAGTILIKGATQTVGHLIVDNGPNPYIDGVETPAPVGLNLDSWETRNFGTMIVGPLENLLLFSNVIDYRLVVQGQITLPAAGADLTIASGGRLDWRRKTKISYDNLTIENGGVLTHSFNGSDIAYFLDIDVQNLFLNAGGLIDVSGRGFASRQGPGYSGPTAGGAYGGKAGRGSSHLSATPYGSIKAPNHLGSGGGGGRGGGLVLIAASTEANLSGTIRANGSAGSSSAGGGGSGGTIHISAGKITGSGALLEASGGGSSGSSGSGSGGRIAVLTSDDQYGILGLNAQAYGGAGGYRDGAAGTIYLLRGTDVNGHLRVNNSTRSYSEDVTTPVLVVEDFDSIGSDSSGTLHIPFGTTFNLPSDVIDYRLVLEGSITTPSVNDITIANGGRLEVRRDLPLIYQNMTIDAGGVLTHSTNTDRKDYVLDIAVDNFVLNGLIDITGKGYMANNGSGAGQNVTGAVAPGAGYGGWGGVVPDSGGGLPYGDFKNPNDLGSGGGNLVNSGSGAITWLGGHGGGLLRLNVASTLTLNGSILANGSAGLTTSSPTLLGGGGSGGAIYIHTQTLEGTGAVLSTVGGNGGGGAGNGSGGRLALIYEVDNYVGGAINMDLRCYGGTAATRPASAGSIFVFDSDSEPFGHLIVDNNNLPHAQGSETPAPVGEDLDSYITRNNGVLLVSPGENFLLHSNVIDYNLVVEGAFSLPGAGTDLTIANGGHLEWRRNSTITLNSLTIQAGGTLTHSANEAGPSYLLDLNLNTLNLLGTIDVTGKGYGPGQGPGVGSSNSGAGYGGQGGVGSDGFISATYGDPKDPVNLGSGTPSRRGGGLVKIQVSGVATLEGSILADGEGGAGCSGSGSGGTIAIYAGEIASTTGVLSAKGGDTCGAFENGGGGGGRIALHYTTDSGVSNLSLQAYGGVGDVYGSAGTIYLNHQGVDTNGRLIVDNNGAPSAEWSTTRLPDGVDFDDLQVGANVRVEIPQGATFALPTNTIDYHLVLGGDFSFPGPGTDFVVASGGTLEIRKNLPVVLDSLTIDAGGTLTHSSNSTIRAYVIDLDLGDFTLNGDINVTGKGYKGGSGPGAPPSGGLAGGSYGGFGGMGTTSTNPQGTPYGQVRTPYDLGSGAANSTGGRGGGLVSVKVSGTATINGNIYADGTVGNSSGGSGGTISLQTVTLSGAGGSAQANGGNGSGNGGSGSGGRIALSYEVDSYTGTVAALGLTSQGGTTNLFNNVGAAGTVFVLDASNVANKGELIINNGANPYRQNVNTYIPDTYAYDNYSVGTNTGIYVPAGVDLQLWTSTLDFALKVAGTVQWFTPDLTMTGTGFLHWESSDPIILDNLTMQTGSSMKHEDNSNAKRYYLDIRVAQDFEMQSGVVIDVSGLGFDGGFGPGRGNDGESTTFSASGGSYGGVGGTGKGGTLPLGTYGTSANPTGLGSGGGHHRSNVYPHNISGVGTSGGGLVMIDVGGTFDFSGEIYANGESTTSTYRGAGTGGSINISTGTLAGSGGVLEAKGGNTPNSLDAGGTGGGGRVFLGYSVNSYVGALVPNVDPGTGHASRLGTAGSVQVN